MRIEDYLDIKARHGDSFLTKEVIEEMTQFVHALQKVRRSKEEVERLIRDFMRSKLGSESRYIEGYGEVDIDPRLWNWDLWDSYLHRFYDYFYREYQNKTCKTIPDAHAYCAFLQYHNMRRKFPQNKQLPDTDDFDIEEAIRAEEDNNKANNGRNKFSSNEFEGIHEVDRINEERDDLTNAEIKDEVVIETAKAFVMSIKDKKVKFEPIKPINFNNLHLFFKKEGIINSNNDNEMDVETFTDLIKYAELGFLYRPKTGKLGKGKYIKALIHVFKIKKVFSDKWVDSALASINLKWDDIRKKQYPELEKKLSQNYKK